MSDNKKYYYMKVKETFFDSEEIKILESLDNGIEYQLFYMKICLLCLKNEGALMFKDLMPYDIKMLSTVTRTPIDVVKNAIEIFNKLGLVTILENSTIYLSDIHSLIGKSSSEAERKQIYRDSLKDGSPKVEYKPVKSNVERQRDFRIKKSCEEKQHIPLIENYINNKRYSGNYYKVFSRDMYKCKMCNSIEKLCVHHIDGYDELKPQNNNENKMVSLCRSCHGIAHSKEGLSNDILESIGYFEYSNESNEILSLNRPPEKEKELDIELDIEKDIKIEKKVNNIQLVIDSFNELHGTTRKVCASNQKFLQNIYKDLKILIGKEPIKSDFVAFFTKAKDKYNAMTENFHHFGTELSTISRNVEGIYDSKIKEIKKDTSRL